MKISNDFVEIKSGKKNILLKNLILNNYLHIFLNNIVDSGNTPNKQYFHKCFIRLDSALTFDTTSQIPQNEFDFWFENPVVAQTPSENSCTISYIFKAINGMVYDADTFQKVEETVFKGRKITAIGFFTSDNSFACAILDVSQYSLFYDEEFSVARQDTISTDGVFYSKDGLTTPSHLYFLNDDIESRLTEIGIGDSYENMTRYSIEAVDFSSTYADNQHVTFAGDENDIENLFSVCRTYLPRYLPMYPTRNSYKKIFYIYTQTQDSIQKEYVEIKNLELTGDLKIKIKYERS